MPRNQRLILGLALYFIGAFMILSPLAEIAVTTFPYRLADQNWRFGAVGVVVQTLAVPLLGVFAIGVAAVLRESRIFLMLAGSIAIITAVVTFIVAGDFVLNAVQLRGAVRAEFATNFYATVIKTLAILLFGTLTSLMLGILCLRAIKTLARRREVDPAIIRPMGLT